MNFSSAHALTHCRFFTQTHHHHHHPCAPKAAFSCSMPRPPNRNRRNRTNRNRRNPTITTTTTTSTSTSTSASDTLQATFDLPQLYHSSHSHLHLFLSSAADALQDLQTLISVDADRRIIFSCRPSTPRFVGNFVVFTCAVVLGFRVLVGLLRLGLRSRWSGSGRVTSVVRRDRSLGGREVVVAKRAEEVVDVRKRKGFGLLDNSLLSRPKSAMMAGLEGISRVRFGKKLPKWWPSTATPQQISVLNNEEYQREANRLVRAITDNRMSGKDIMEDDIIHLRQICRTSRVRVSFDTTNTRDSFYRVSVDFVLNVCSRAPSHSTSVEIDGEDARQFIAGLSENIGIDNIRAGRIVSAAVAARTRSRFLQAWALVMQGQHGEAVVELSKMCLVWRIFPPEESSPEMEMVARGLEKHLKVEQREFLLSMLVGICSEESQRRAAEALGLVSSFRG